MAPLTLAVGMVTVPEKVGPANGAAPVTSAKGILLTVLKADVPFPLTYPLANVLAPVPPAVTGRVPVVSALVLDAYTAPPLV